MDKTYFRFHQGAVNRLPAVGTVILLILCLSLPVKPSRGADDQSGTFQPQDLHLSEAMKRAKITVVEFFPLPSNRLPGTAFHERVFTDEFRSDSPEDAKISGWFVPNDYLSMIRQALQYTADIHKLNLEIVNNVGNISASSNLIVLGTVMDFTYGNNATVTTAVQLLAGHDSDFRQLAEKSISRVIDPGDFPMILNYPLHTIGQHANDFHPARVLLNMAAVECIVDLLRLMDEKVREK